MNAEARSGPTDQNSAVGLKSIWKDLVTLPKVTNAIMIRHLLLQACTNLLRAPLTTGLTLITVAFALLLLAGFLLCIQNIRTVLRGSQHEQRLIVYMHENASEEQTRSLSLKLARDPSVESVKVVGKKTALEQFSQQLGEQANILQGLETDNPLPNSIEVQFKQPDASEETFQRFVNSYSDLPLVEYIQYSHGLIEQLSSILQIFRLGGGLALALMLLIITFIITNTIKLALFAHREEIEIMRLVGATDSYIRAPFLIEGIFQGFIGAGIGLFSLYLVYSSIVSLISSSQLALVFVPQIEFLSFGAILLILLLGLAVGLAGSFMAVRKFSVD